MKYLITGAVCVLTLSLTSAFSQIPLALAERKTIHLDVLLIDLKNQPADDFETLVRDRARFNKTIADGKIKLVSSIRMRCLTGEANNLRIGQRIPTPASNSPQAQYENTGFNLSVTLNLAVDKMIEVQYTMDWSATIANYLQANSAFIQRQISGLTRLNPNELTPIMESIQREPFWKPATPSGQEKPNESTGNFLLLFLGKVAD